MWKHGFCSKSSELCISYFKKKLYNVECYYEWYNVFENKSFFKQFLKTQHDGRAFLHLLFYIILLHNIK